MSDFDGAPLVIGRVRGVRSFLISPDGVLRGPMRHTEWLPGENTADCIQTAAALFLMLPFTNNLVSRPDGLYTHNGKRIISWPPAAPDAGHSMATCSCGFYAYHDGSDDYRTDATVSAVIEGWGNVMLGTRGFRAEKARIIALCIPRRPLTERLRPHGYIWPAWAALAALNTTIGLAAIIGGSWTGVFNLAAATFMTLIARESAYGGTTGRHRTTDPRTIPLRRRLRLRKQYPDIPVFSTFTDMVTAFPPDRGRSEHPDAETRWDAA